MKTPFAAAMLTGALLGAAAIAQSTAPTGPTAQPSAAITTSQSSQEPNSPPIQANDTSQTATTPAQANNSDVSNPKRLAPGSVIPVQLTKTIDAKKAKTGDALVAKVMQDVKSNTGQVVIAKDTKVIGHITEAQPRSKEQKQSQLALAFDRAITKDGQEMQISMSIQAVIGQENDQVAGVGSREEPTPEPRTTQSPMSRPAQPQPTGLPPSADDGEGVQTPRQARPSFNEHTQGVVGISNLSLQQANVDQGSVITSEKNNVKLESGTILLLKVN